MPNASNRENNEQPSNVSQSTAQSTTTRSSIDSLSDYEPEKTSLKEVLGVTVLVVGLIGYGVYQNYIRPPELMPSPVPSTSPSSKATPPLPKPSTPSTQITPSLPASSRSAPSLPASPAPTATSTLNPTASLPATASKNGAVNSAVEDIYQRPPKVGTYYAASPLLNSSNREIASNRGRFCIKIVDGPVAPASGTQQVIVSSLSFQQGGIYVDATQEKLAIDRSYTELSDRRGTWQLLEGTVDRSGAMEACLAATTPYVHQEQGAMIKGRQ